MDRASAPTEDEQMESYAAILRALGRDHPVIIRTLDVGGDKPLPYLPIPREDNPFLGTRQLHGLLVLQALFENQDIKASNNTIYTLKAPVDGASRWYVVRDLGYALGQASFNGPRNDIDAYERAPFIREVVDGKVRFHFGGRYKGLLDPVTVADVVWICERLTRLSDRQWRDAFRAGGYEPSIADRYIARIKARVAEGLALDALAR